MENNKCKICRRAGDKLFLKGERCISPKCSIIRRPYPPGVKGKRKKSALSEYGKELGEKQRLRNWYNLRERQFSNYVKEILGKRGKVDDASALLIETLESRLDNVVFRIGFAASRSQAKQMVSHGHFLVNGRKIDVPSYRVKKGNKISLRPQSVKKSIFKDVSALMRKNKAPAWIKVSTEKMEGEITGRATLDEVIPPAEILSIFEYYSR